jgi:pullulanase
VLYLDTELDANVTGFLLDGTQAEGETAEAIIALFNPNANSTTVTLPEGNWNVYVDGEKAGTTPLRSVTGDVVVDAISAMVLVREDQLVEAPVDNTQPADAPAETPAPENQQTVTKSNTGIFAGIAVGIVVVLGAILAWFLRKK